MYAYNKPGHTSYHYNTVYNVQYTRVNLIYTSKYLCISIHVCICIPRGQAYVYNVYVQNITVFWLTK